MFSPAIQGLLVQARVEELHRAAQTSNRRIAIATPGSDVNRPEAVPLTTLVKRGLGRVFDGGLPRSDEPAASHGAQLVGHTSTTNWSQRC
jgi:hypothetical protein